MEALACISLLVNEVLILDGNSDDGTRDALDWLASVCPKIKIFSCNHNWKSYQDIARSENQAQKYTSGEFLFRLHLDEILDIRSIENIHKNTDIISYLCKSKTLVSFNSVGSARLPVEGFRIFRKNSSIKSTSDGFLSGNFEPSENINISFYHMPWFFPVHWKDKTNSLGPLWNWKGLFAYEIFGNRKYINIDNFSRDELIQKVIQFSESSNIIKDDTPFYLCSLDQFSKYHVRKYIITDILNYKNDNLMTT